MSSFTIRVCVVRSLFSAALRLFAVVALEMGCVSELADGSGKTLETGCGGCRVRCWKTLETGGVWSVLDES